MCVNIILYTSPLAPLSQLVNKKTLPSPRNFASLTPPPPTPPVSMFSAN